MLQSIREKGLPCVWPALIGALFALGLVLPVLYALDMGGSAMAVAVCLLTGACCAVAGMGGRLRWIGYGAIALAMLLVAMFTGALTHMPAMIGAVLELVRGDAGSLRAYGNEMALLATCLLTIAGWAMARQATGFYPALSMTMVVLLIIWFSARRDAVWLLAPALVALCAMFARSSAEETPFLRIILSSALAVMLALSLSPLLQFRSPTLENFAERLRTYITDTLFFTEPRSIYSIQADGYKPLETRLGGPVDEDNERPVMTVETPRSILLRGVIYNEYNGLNWIDTLSTRRYLYSDPRNRAIRAEVMDEQRPGSALRGDGLFDLIDVTVTMHSGSASTLFVPQRVQDLSTPMAMVPYFNMSGEIFITRDLEAGETYSFSAPVILPTDSRLPALLNQASRGAEDRDLSYYLRVPDAVAPNVHGLVRELTESETTALDKALAIMNHLRTNYTYTTRPAMPPDQQDFVSYFLLRGKAGYCTYYASAMAIMARIAGLPARYVEGYVVDPSGGVALVTSKQAHAWAEIYFPGFGWIAFDATPPRSQGGPRQDDPTPDEEPPSGQEDEQDEDTQDADDPDAAPSPTPPPEDDDGNEPPPEDDPRSGEDPEDDPSPSPQPDDQPTPSPNPDELPQDNPEDTPNPNRKRSPSLWWLWLLLLVAIGLLVWRGLWTRPEAVAARHTNDVSKLLTWYKALLGLLAASGMPARPHETPLRYAKRVEQGIPKEAGFMALAEDITRIGYARWDASPEEVAAAAACYQQVYKAMPIRGRAKWLITRMLKGIGSVRQVP